MISHTTGTTAEYVARRAHERWLRTRAAGRVSFIWRYGVIGWGLPAGALSAVLPRAPVPGHGPPTPLSVAAVRPLWGSLAGLPRVCGVVGYLLGAWLWDFCEARFGE